MYTAIYRILNTKHEGHVQIQYFPEILRTKHRILKLVYCVPLCEGVREL